MKRFLIFLAVVAAFVLGYGWRHVQIENSENSRALVCEDDLYKANHRIDNLVTALSDKAAMETIMQRFPLIDVRLEFKQRGLPVKKVKK